MMERLVGLLWLLLGAPIQLGDSGWSFTHWGMSLQEVLAARPDHAVRLTEDEIRVHSIYIDARCQVGIDQPEPFHGMDFAAAVLCFDEEGLARVDFLADDASFNRIKAVLFDHLGGPVREHPGPFPSVTYLSPNDGTVVRVLRTNLTVVSFAPTGGQFAAFSTAQPKAPTFRLPWEPDPALSLDPARRAD